ncbi:N-acetyl-alpha-D-glucosaminyl L-malate synthase [Fundidesulfovibrio magnetotacticus]|uniref:N-acetyl-alpha-D-glucosaminyl L-malate synthase n=1 Tax=Fundidesulfovibrio magnetotacticus TaxID=2730080 RepID=A0A6V8M1B5_9BACT|nr:glycosyltransferase [Fundidesulfovibrio magnetotacticus]GFK95746.1 N-acetyl-alpha-D-glucosaminyl L-malate synthase [Fundidesulfovibrio magnetotacticus]
MSGPCRLVLLLQDLCYGGTQRHALELARGIDRARFAPELWSLCKGADFAPEAAAAGIPVQWITDQRSVSFRSVLALRAAILRERPAVLMPLTAVPNIWGRLWGRLAGLPLVLGTVRGGGNIKRQHERFLAPLAGHHITNTQALKDALLKLGRPDHAVTVIRNGVDTDRFSPDPDGIGPVRKVVLCVARFVDDKDHPTLLAAFERLHARMPDAELWLVGDGPLKGRFEFAARRLECGRNIRVFPGGPNLVPFYRQASVLALSSLREGLPNVVLEAMACGVPVAATAVGGIPEVVEEERTGRLSPAGDPEGLARNLERLLADEETRERMGRAARARAVEDFSLRSMVARHEELLDRLRQP